MDTVSMRVVPRLCWITYSEVSFLRADDAGLNVTSPIALVLAPLFVHYEILFMFGLSKQAKKDLHNDVGKLKTEFRLKKKGVKKE